MYFISATLQLHMSAPRYIQFISNGGNDNSSQCQGTLTRPRACDFLSAGESCTIFYVRETQFTIIPLQGFQTPSVSGKQNFFLRVKLSNHHLTDKTEVIKSHLIIKGSNAFPIGKP